MNIQALRLFTSTPAAWARLSKRAQSNKEQARRLVKRRSKNKADPQSHHLYMDIPTAMRYLRAAEVGQPAQKTTVALQLAIVADKGATPMLGRIFFPKLIKSLLALVFAELPEQQAAVKAVDDSAVVGGDELVQQIKDGALKIDHFDVCYATPGMAVQLRALARVLGPRGLMPSVKKSTVSENVAALLESNSGAQPFQQKGDNLAIPVGRCDFSDAEIVRNIQAAAEAVHSCQPAGAKKVNLVGQCSISSTLGPSVVIDFRR